MFLYERLFGQTFRFQGQCDRDRSKRWSEKRVGLSAPAVGLYELQSGPRKGAKYVRIVSDGDDSAPRRCETWLHVRECDVVIVDPHNEFADGSSEAGKGGSHE